MAVIQIYSIAYLLTYLLAYTLRRFFCSCCHRC